jgi:hypothetical protein
VVAHEKSQHPSSTPEPSGEGHAGREKNQQTLDKTSSLIMKKKRKEGEEGRG